MGSRTTPSAEPTWEIAWSMTGDRSPHRRCLFVATGVAWPESEERPWAPGPDAPWGTHQGASGSVRSSKERTTTACGRWDVPRRGTPASALYHRGELNASMLAKQKIAEDKKFGVPCATAEDGGQRADDPARRPTVPHPATTARRRAQRRLSRTGSDS